MRSIADEKWTFLEQDPVTFVKTYYRHDANKQIQVLKTMPEFIANQLIEENKEKAKLFDDMGGWKKAKHGAVVANVPDIIDQEWKRACGWDPRKGGWYDRKKYNTFLNNPDFAHFRTGGGKIGERIADAPMLPSARKIIPAGGL